MTATRKQLFDRALVLGVEIDEDAWSGFRHFHAYAPGGKTFIGSSVHNAAIGDTSPGETPDWKAMLNEIEVEDCDYGPECDYCHPEDEA